LILTQEPRIDKNIVPNLHAKIIVNGLMKKPGAPKTLIAWLTNKNKAVIGIKLTLITAVTGEPLILL
jgi:hypothetical protein